MKNMKGCNNVSVKTKSNEEIRYNLSACIATVKVIAIALGKMEFPTTKRQVMS